MAVGGLSGSGKSFLAKLLSERFGYRWIRSDVIRKELAGIPLEKSAKALFGKGIYTEEMTRRVYGEMIRRAKEHLKRGEKVVLDATFLKRWQRELLKELGEVLFLWLEAPEEVVKERLKRRRDVSDADFSVYLEQKRRVEEPEGAVRLRTDRPPEELLKEVEALLSG